MDLALVSAGAVVCAGWFLLVVGLTDAQLCCVGGGVPVVF
jgi:hypothetical protein